VEVLSVFDDLLRELRRLERAIRVPVTVAVDDEGYIDRHCAACAFGFKVLFEDWRTLVKDEAAYCPRCGREAPATDWNTPEQSQSLEAQGLAHVHEVLNRAIANDARRFNAAQPRTGWIRLSLSHRRGGSPLLIPVETAAAMRRMVSCEECMCRYASIGAAFFCPACGHNSAGSMFAGAIDQARSAIGALPSVREAVLETHGADVAEDTVRGMREDTVENVVIALHPTAPRRASCGASTTPNLLEDVGKVGT